MKISSEVLEGLSRTPKTEKTFEQLVFKASIQLGLCLKRPSETDNQSLYFEVWENTLNHLDSHHPGWRGYFVQVDGGVI